MSKMFAWFFALCIAILVGLPTGAYAQATRTWVSGVGDDVNPCSRTAPCKTFAGAISKTAAGGEINVLDPGGFGTVTITKSITIDGQGTEASILASATNGINVNAGVNDTVILRNLSINGAGTTLGLNGVNYLAGKKLVVENCVIFNFSQNAVSIAPSTSGAKAIIVNSTLMSNAFGVAISTANAAGAISADVTDTRIVQNNNAGVSALVPGGKPSLTLFLDRVVSSFNNSGVVSNGAGSSVTLTNSTIQGNGTGVFQTGGGTLSSFKNNSISGNGSDGTPIGTILQLN